MSNLKDKVAIVTGASKGIGAAIAKRPHRDADAAIVQPRCLPAAGKFTRVGRRERSLSSRMGSLYSSRFLMNMPRLGPH